MDGQLKTVQAPNGEALTLSNLPVGNPRRWLPAMKARVVAATRGGLTSIEDASRRYGLFRQEYEFWRKAVADR